MFKEYSIVYIYFQFIRCVITIFKPMMGYYTPGQVLNQYQRRTILFLILSLVDSPDRQEEVVRFVCGTHWHVVRLIAPLAIFRKLGR